MWYLVEKEGGYEVSFGKHDGKDLDEAIVEDYQYWDWVIWKSGYVCEETREIVADRIEALRMEGVL